MKKENKRTFKLKAGCAKYEAIYTYRNKDISIEVWVAGGYIDYLKNHTKQSCLTCLLNNEESLYSLQILHDKGRYDIVGAILYVLFKDQGVIE